MEQTSQLKVQNRISRNFVYIFLCIRFDFISAVYDLTFLHNCSILDVLKVIMDATMSQNHPLMHLEIHYTSPRRRFLR